jgi:hypothetical protein
MLTEQAEYRQTGLPSKRAEFQDRLLDVFIFRFAISILYFQNDRIMTLSSGVCDGQWQPRKHPIDDGFLTAQPWLSGS